MEWNTKWEWENHEIFSSKVTTSPKDVQSANWEEKSCVVGSSNGSASDKGYSSSKKSSISTSTESSSKEELKVSNLSLGAFGGEVTETFMLVSSGEPCVGLGHGKRTYFENSFVGRNSKESSFSDIPILSVSSTGKKSKPSNQSTPIPHCQVEGCNLDLSSAKEYHRKHRVCSSHSRCPKVVVGGLERRFCQQCSRFHSLSEFDERKRSCRRRLSDHNARRRKSQQGKIQFNSTNLTSSIYGGRQQLSFVLNKAPLIKAKRPKPDVRSTWDESSNSTNPLYKVKYDKSVVLDGTPHSQGMQLPNAATMPTIAFNRQMASKGNRVEVLDQDFKESLSPSVDALDLRRALSLLSNNKWGLYEPDLAGLNHPQPTHLNNPATLQHHGLHYIHQGLPHPSPDNWQVEQQSIDPHIHPITAKTNNPANSQFQ